MKSAMPDGLWDEAFEVLLEPPKVFLRLLAMQQGIDRETEKLARVEIRPGPYTTEKELQNA